MDFSVGGEGWTDRDRWIKYRPTAMQQTATSNRSGVRCVVLLVCGAAAVCLDLRALRFPDFLPILNLAEASLPLDEFAEDLSA